MRIVRRIPGVERKLDGDGNAVAEPERDSDVQLVEHRGLYGLAQRPHDAFELVERHRIMPPRRWMEIAVGLMLQGLEFWSTDPDGVLGSDAEGYRPTAWGEDIAVGRMVSPDYRSPSGAAIAEGRVAYSYDEPALLDESRGVHGPYTVLRRQGTASGTVFAVAVTGDKELAMGIEAAMIAEWSADPSIDRSGRIIVVPAYYDQPMRVRLVDTDLRASQDEDRGQHWEVAAQLAVEMEIVVLVKEPGLGHHGAEVEIT